MPDEEKKPEVAYAAARAGEEQKSQPYTTAEDLAPKTQGTRNPALSQSPGLRAVPDSKVPGLAGGGMVSHVFGPGQNPVDPIAAGLDTNYIPATRHEQRPPTQTGVDGAGLRPSTYAEKPGGNEVKQAADNTHETVAAKPDTESGTAAVAAAEPATDAVPEGQGGPQLAHPEGQPKTDV